MDRMVDAGRLREWLSDESVLGNRKAIVKRAGIDPARACDIAVGRLKTIHESAMVRFHEAARLRKAELMHEIGLLEVFMSEGVESQRQ
jgi:hypothetical protein